MRIAVEIDNIVRDNNGQALKYFRKECDSSYGDDTEIDLNCTDLLSELPFPNNETRKVFKEIDYPYELFGCAKATHKHLHVEVDDWLGKNPEDDIIYFSLNESDLMIQSTYFFLSKGSRVRTMLFPKDAKEIWNQCDTVVTINKDVISNKPEGKKLIVIKKSDNEEFQKNADLVYDSLIAFLNDENYKIKLSSSNETEPLKETKIDSKTNNLLNKIKNIFTNNG